MYVMYVNQSVKDRVTTQRSFPPADHNNIHREDKTKILFSFDLLKVPIQLAQDYRNNKATTFVNEQCFNRKICDG